MLKNIFALLIGQNPYNEKALSPDSERALSYLG
jgi:hypothetical protein